jgi:hypothetical protein
MPHEDDANELRDVMSWLRLITLEVTFNVVMVKRFETARGMYSHGIVRKSIPPAAQLPILLSVGVPIDWVSVVVVGITRLCQLDS